MDDFAHDLLRSIYELCREHINPKSFKLFWDFRPRTLHPVALNPEPWIYLSVRPRPRFLRPSGGPGLEMSISLRLKTISPLLACKMWIGEGVFVPRQVIEKQLSLDEPLSPLEWIVSLLGKNMSTRIVEEVSLPVELTDRHRS